jgi:predicted NAD-dependent protein-ADP-ribosyltransferase YbiA (DUF1768 family)
MENRNRTLKCRDKVCPEGKVCNPLTGRCIKVRATRRAEKTSKGCSDKVCPEGKVCNPLTGRCIKIRGEKVSRSKSKSKKTAAGTKKQPCQTMTDKLFFYSQSKDVAPGKGTNEVVADASVYKTLDGFPNWRKVLSNFHHCPFVYEGRTYNTIEHVFQAKKIALVSPEKADWFTVESGHEIGKGDGLVARRHRKLVTLNDRQLQEWSAIRDKVMRDAAVQKYAACKEARDILKATACAQLWHIVSRAKPIRFTHLEGIRDTL